MTGIVVTGAARLHDPRRWASGLLTGGAFVVASVLFGVALAARPSVAVVVPGGLVWLLVLADWRRGLRALTWFLPFAGLPIFLIASRYAPVLKDVLLVLPLYLSYAASCIRERRPLLPARDPVIAAMGIFVLLVVAYAAWSPSLLGAAIGVKVWLAYLPLYVIGQAIAARVEEVVRIVRITALLAIVPVGIGIAETIYFKRQGDFGPLMPLYGPLRGTIVRQVSFGQAIPRIPSTFTFAGSYYNFGLLALGCAFAIWSVQRRRLGWALPVFLAIGFLLDGTRRGYVTGPIVLLVPIALAKGRFGARARAAMVPVLAVALLAFAGAQVARTAGLLRSTSQFELRALVQEIAPTVRHGFLGHGTGTNTNAAFRYGDHQANRSLIEGWYTKAVYELGLAGGLAAVALVLLILRQAAAALRSHDATVRALAPPLFAVLLATALTLVKASELDWDPMNAYFFLFAGMLAGLGALSPATDPASPGRRDAAQ